MVYRICHQFSQKIPCMRHFISVSSYVRTSRLERVEFKASLVNLLTGSTTHSSSFHHSYVNLNAELYQLFRAINQNCKPAVATNQQVASTVYRVTSFLHPLRRSVHTKQNSQPHLLDLRHPASWYPVARQIPRKIIAHLGPTNSGKTHNALDAMKQARSGVYCGPLRLLACEISERLTSTGLPCSLITGQEVREEPGSKHTSCTVEMASISEVVEVAVLDEIQMIGDPGRGWGWTRALLGIPASTIHVCGSPEVLPLLRTLVAECGDELEVKGYNRLSQLVVMSEALKSVENLKPGDCLVAFSRRAVHGLKRDVLRHTSHPCAVVYGALPPSTRSQQAALFNGSLSHSQQKARPPSPTPNYPSSLHSAWEEEPIRTQSTDRVCYDEYSSVRDAASCLRDAGYTAPTGSAGQAVSSSSREAVGVPSVPPSRGVLVASDAIGMGLNLNIGRIIFTALRKYDGTETRNLSTTEVKQIAGRAGRYRSAHPVGYVTCLHQKDVGLLHEALAAKSRTLVKACLMPRPEDISSFVVNNSKLRYDAAIIKFVSKAKLSSHYCLADTENMVKLASMLHVSDQDSRGITVMAASEPH
ncbi:hypothetical protein CEUSTIGMA_g9101.t1 [Chlamydomonas eustigma]|uniref:RNA helicase n=1 Tax=Chlamydomonas eustigma TaxID=1157962 RepID=A0A250XF45_9CHLO|nr:hypothetical protein CEUSTIGMA_g9101.t1 [Chlamydomonas eustigma]|eukprot:GAX81673.1 hypothetical protein CEUSTIGMA_g9101.t1 [Chlamydomonas eustigma]